MRLWLARILICLILGAIVNVTVAWGLVLLAPMESKHEWVFPDLGLPAATARHEQDADRAAAWLAQTGAFADFDGDVHPMVIVRGLGVTWQAFIGLPAHVMGGEGLMAFRITSGWPRPALEFSRFADHHVPEMFDEIERDLGPVIDAMMYSPNERVINRQSMLPLTPILPGFLIDTLFYGALWFGLLFGFGATRAARRTRRGRCPQCAYDLRGDLDAGCPECGWGREGDEP